MSVYLLFIFAHRKLTGDISRMYLNTVTGGRFSFCSFTSIFLNIIITNIFFPSVCFYSAYLYLFLFCQLHISYSITWHSFPPWPSQVLCALPSLSTLLFVLCVFLFTIKRKMSTHTLLSPAISFLLRILFIFVLLLLLLVLVLTFFLRKAWLRLAQKKKSQCHSSTCILKKKISYTRCGIKRCTHLTSAWV